jgi:catechol 2,3-dioxygenase-like lactoylglutathione lyase family enzyme
MSDIRNVSAVTLATHDMARAVAFYEKLGFVVSKGGRDADFTTFQVGATAFNLIRAGDDRRWSWWGRVIFYVSSVDAMYERAVSAGIDPDFAPRDAPWNERYFHVTDPDSHEISFAAPLPSEARHGQ